MHPRFATPRELCQALTDRAPEAREHFVSLFRKPLGRLMAQLALRHGRAEDEERLTVYALRLAEMWLRTLPPEQTGFLSWEAFRAAVLLHVAKLASQPFAPSRDWPHGFLTLPESDLFSSRSLFLPCHPAADLPFGGDWFGGGQGVDGSLWVLLADATGHGYPAHLLASALPGVWKRCWEAAPAEPAGLLSAMHDLLEDSLPEGVYVEGTLVRLEPGGSVTVAPAGGSRLVLRRQGGQPTYIQLSGFWLGLMPPSLEDQRSWHLGVGDELLLSTDGVFDQLSETGARPADLLGTLDGELFEGLERLLRHALAQGPQRDDITMILLRRCGPSAAGPGNGRAAGGSRYEGGNVSV